MATEMQTIPARHGVATFVPAGHTIKIINSSGSQVVDTWVFALPKPEAKQPDDREEAEKEESPKPDDDVNTKEQSKPKTPQNKKVSKRKNDFPSQEEAEKLTKEEIAKAQEKDNVSKQQNKWSSYVPSIGKWTSTGNKNADAEADKQDTTAETEQQKDSRKWASYFPSGKAISSYIPKQASDTVSAFAASHYRDQSKSYFSQLRDFSKTPVGAAGLAAMSGSGYGSSLYAGYQAWNFYSSGANDGRPEYLSPAHTRVTTGRLRPQTGDVLMTNLRAPIMTVLEDTSGGVHDGLIPACDPARYRELGVEGWEAHGSCAENLVLALKELNDSAGLKGPKGVGAYVTVDGAPAPLNLFMNVPWDAEGGLRMEEPVGREGGYVRWRAERDVVVVMSACPQDVTGINGREIADAHFVVEEEAPAEKLRKARGAMGRTSSSQVQKKRVPPRKLSSAQGSGQSDGASTSTQVRKKPIPPQIKSKTAPANQGQTVAQATEGASPAKIATSRSMKKPIPPTIKEQASNGEASVPTERKKPRKLMSKSKTQGASS